MPTAFRALLFLLSLLTLARPAAAQQPEPVRVSGSVSDRDTRQSIPGASVWNLSRQRRAVADAAGDFSVSVNPTDTLEFRAVGYEAQRLTVGRTSLSQLVLQVQLRRANILLDGVTVREGRPADALISRALRNMKRPVPPVVSQVKRPPKPKPLFPVDSAAPAMARPTLQSPVSLLYDQFSRAGMQRRKMDEIMAQKRLEAAQRATNQHFLDNRGYEVKAGPAPPTQPPAGSLAPRT